MHIFLHLGTPPQPYCVQILVIDIALIFIVSSYIIVHGVAMPQFLHSFTYNGQSFCLQLFANNRFKYTDLHTGGRENELFGHSVHI